MILQRKLMAVASKLTRVEFSQEPAVPIAEYICFADNTNIFFAADSGFHGYMRPSSTDSQDTSWIWALTVFCRGVAVDRPIVTKPAMISVLKKVQKYANYTTDRPTCHLGISQSRQIHVANIAGGVIGEHACTHYFDSVHGRDKRWGHRSHLSPLTHIACITLSEQIGTKREDVPPEWANCIWTLENLRWSVIVCCSATLSFGSVHFIISACCCRLHFTSFG